ncbi:g12699 [Coccomyxa viridis]|uniref:G12699 protein n=1 Tax=Coccomyxa viridis TaxID=1274662 RepID=A0ABP1GAZ8_9CHLO
MTAECCASRKLAQGNTNTNVNVNIPGVAASKGPAQGQSLLPPSPPSFPSPPSPPPVPPGQVNTNVQVSPAGQGGVNVVVKTPPVPGPQTAVDVNVPGFFTGFIEVGR